MAKEKDFGYGYGRAQNDREEEPEWWVRPEQRERRYWTKTVRSIVLALLLVVAFTVFVVLAFTFLQPERLAAEVFFAPPAFANFTQTDWSEEGSFNASVNVSTTAQTGNVVLVGAVPFESGSTSGWTTEFGAATLSTNSGDGQPAPSLDYTKSAGTTETAHTRVDLGTPGDGTYLWDVKRASTANSEGILLYFAYGGSGNNYVVYWRNDGFFRLFKDATSSEIGLQLSPGPDPQVAHGGGWNTVKIEKTGSTIKGYVNDALQWTVTDSSHTSGKVGIGYRTDASGTTGAVYSVDNIRPPSNFTTSGVIESTVFDAGQSAFWTHLKWNETLPEGTDIKMQVRTSEDNVTWPSFEAEFSADANTIALWHLNNAGTDASGNGWGVALEGSGSFVTDVVRFGSGSLLSPRGDQNNGAETISNFGGLSSDSPLTVEAWIYPLADHSEYNIVMWRDTFTDNGFVLTASTPKKIGFALCKAKSCAVISSPDNTLTLNQWQHVAGTWDGKTLRLFHNGNLVGSSAYTGGYAAPTGFKLHLGGDNIGNRGGDTSFGGYIDEVRISNTARYTSNFIPDLGPTVSTSSGSGVNLKGRYGQWRAILTTENASVTPTLHDVELNYNATPTFVWTGKEDFEQGILNRIDTFSAPGSSKLGGTFEYNDSTGITIAGAQASKLAVTNGRFEFNGVTQGDDAYAYSSVASGAGNYTVDFDLNVSSTASTSGTGDPLLGIGFGATANNIDGMADTDLFIIRAFASNFKIEAAAKRNNAFEEPDWATQSPTFNFNTVYYARLKRTGTNLSAQIFSDAGRTSLLGNSFVTISSVKDFPFLIHGASRAVASAYSITGYTDNLNATPAFGTLASVVFNSTNSSTNWTALRWDATLPPDYEQTFDGLNDGNLAGQDGWGMEFGSAAAFQVQQAVVKEGTKTLLVKGEGDNAVSRAIPQSTTYTLTVWGRADSQSGVNTPIQLWEDGTFVGSIGFWDGNIIEGSTSDNSILQAYTNQKWYELTITIDSSGTARYFVDGVEKHSEDKSASITNGINKVRFYTKSSGSTYFDHIRLSKGVAFELISFQVRASDTPFNKTSPEWAPDADTVALWHLNEGSGTTTADSSGNGNTGTLVNGVAWTTGKFSNALQFDGTDDRVDVPISASLSPTQALTLEAWVTFDSTTANRRIIVERQTTTSPFYGYGLEWDSGNFVIVVNLGNTIETLSVPYTPTVGVWYHVAGTYDSTDSTLRLFVDGTQIGTKVSSIGGQIKYVGGDPNVLSIGGLAPPHGPRLPWHGKIDEVRISNTARTAAEIAEAAAGGPSWIDVGGTSPVNLSNVGLRGQYIQWLANLTAGSSPVLESVTVESVPEVEDTTPPQWSQLTQNTSTPLEGQSVNLSAFWTDDVALDKAILETNETGSLQNFTDGTYGSPLSLSGTSSYSNFTWTNPSITAGTSVGWRIWTNDTSGKVNVTDFGNFTVVSVVVPTPVFVSPTPANNSVTNTTVTFNVSVSGGNTIDSCQLELDGLNQTILDNVGSGTEISCITTNASMTEGNHTFRVWVNDTLGNYNVTESGDNRTITVDNTTPIPVFVDPTPIDGSTVAFGDDVVFNVSVRDNLVVNSSLLELDGKNVTVMDRIVVLQDIQEFETDSGTTGLWHFNENSGTTASDASGNGNNLTLSNGAKFNDTDQLFGASALELDGVDDFAVNGTFTTFSPLTIEAWINLKAYPSTFAGIASNDDTFSRLWGFLINSAGKLVFAVPESIDTSPAIGATTIPLNTWAHVAATWDGTTCRLWLNGLLDGASSQCLQIVQASAYHFDVGFSHKESSSFPFNGLIDEVRVSNFVRTAAEIAEAAAGVPSTVFTTINDSMTLGSHTFRVWANDSAGNYNVTESRTITVGDDVAPTPVFVDLTPANNTVVNSTVIFNVSVTDNVAVASCLLELDGQNTTLLKNLTFEDTFESYTLGSDMNGQGGWIQGQSGATFSVDSVAQQGSKAVKLIDDTALPRLYHPIDRFAPATVRAWMRSENAQSDTILWVVNDTVHHRAILEFGGNIVFGVTDTGVAYSTGTWYEFEIDVLTNGNANYKVYDTAGNLIASANNVAPLLGHPVGIGPGNNVALDGGSAIVTGSTHYFDHVRVLTSALGRASASCIETNRTMTDGNHTFRVWTNDTSGNYNVTESRTITVDLEPPRWSQLAQNVTDTLEFGQSVNLSAFWNDTTSSLSFAVLETNETAGELRNISGFYGSHLALSGKEAYSNFSWFNASILPGTSIGWRIWANDTIGNFNVTDFMNFTVVDTVPPDVVLVAPEDGALTNATVVFRASVTDNVAVDSCELEMDGLTNESMDVTGAGTPAATCDLVNASMTDGPHSFRVWVNDSSGNYNVSAARSITVDAVPPTPVFVSPTPENNTFVNGTVTFNVSVTDNIEVNSCLLEIEGKNTTLLDKVGSGAEISCIVTNTSMVEGNRTFRVWVNDTVGNYNVTESRTVTVDLTPPRWSQLLQNESVPLPGELIRLSAFWEENNVTLAQAILETNESGGEFRNVSGFYGSPLTFGAGVQEAYSNFTWANASVPQGVSVGWRIYANDTLGNMNRTDLMIFTIKDIVEPNVTFADPNPPDGALRAPFIVFNTSVSDNVALHSCSFELDGENVTITEIIGATLTNCTFVNASMTNGTHTYRVWANDTTGNVNVTETRTIVIDAVPPTPVFVAPTPENNSEINVGTVSFSAAITDNVEVRGCLLDLNGTNYTMLRIGSGASLTCSTTNSSMILGNHTFVVWANDTAGNFNASESRTIRIFDDAAPVPAFVEPTPEPGAITAPRVIFNVSVTDNFGVDSCSLELDGIENVTYVQTAGSALENCTFVNVSMTNGTHTFRVWVNDSSGNYAPTDPRTIEVDADPPFWSQLSQNASLPVPGEVVRLSAFWNDSFTNLSFALLETNETGVFQNKTAYGSPLELNGTRGVGNHSNFTWVNAAVAQGTSVGWRIWVNDSLGNFNVTDLAVFKVRDIVAPLLLFIPPTPPDAAITGTRVSFNVSVSDNVAVDVCSLELDGLTNETMDKPGSGPTVGCGKINASMTVGAHTFRVWVNDTSGNLAVTASRTLTVDAAEPTWEGPVANVSAAFKGDAVQFNATWTDDVALGSWMFETNDTGIMVNQTPQSFGGGTGPKKATQVYVIQAAKKTVLWRFWVNDSAGNMNVTENQTLPIGDKVPSSTLLSPAPAASILGPPFGNVSTFRCAADDDVELTSMTLYGNFTGVWDANATKAISGLSNETFFNVTLGEGFYEWNCEATDDAGQTAFAAANRTLTFRLTDTAPPLITFVAPTPANESFVIGDVTINVSVTDQPEGGLVGSCTVQLGGTNFSMDVVGSGTTVSCIRNLTLPRTGAQTITVFSRDVLGNVGSAVITVVIDLQPPFFTDPQRSIETVLTNDTVIFNVTARDNLALGEWTFSANDSGAFVNSSGIFLGGTEELVEINRTITAPSGTVVAWRFYATDFAGNLNATELQLFTVGDFVPPTVVLESPADGTFFIGPALIDFRFTPSDNVGIESCSLLTNVTGDFTANASISNVSNGAVNSISLDFQANSGVFLWNVNCTDIGGNSATAPANRTLTYDGAGPVITFVAPTPVSGNVSNFTTAFVVNVTVSDALVSVDSCTVDINGTVSPMTKVGSGKNVSCEFTTPTLPEGVYSYRVSANDTSGLDTTTVTRTFTIDVSPPVVTLTSPADHATINLLFASFGFTVADTTGTGCSLYTNESGTWAARPTFTFNDLPTRNFTRGVFLWNINCTDAVNLSAFAAANRTINITNVNPVVGYIPPTPFIPPILPSLPPCCFTQSSSVTIAAQAFDDVAIEECRLQFDGINITEPAVSRVATGANATCSATVDGLTEGPHNYKIYARDDEGNWAATPTVGFSRDTTPPTVEAVSPAQGETVLPPVFPPSVTFQYIPADNIALFRCFLYIDGSLSPKDQPFGISASNGVVNSASRGVSSGEHTWRVDCTDNVGLGGSTGTTTFFVDSVPDISLVAFPDAFTQETAITVTASVTDDEFVDSCLFELDGGENLTMTRTGTFTDAVCEISQAGLLAGVHTFKVWANDSTGRFNFASRAFTIDLAEPTVTLVSGPSETAISGTRLQNFSFIPEDDVGFSSCALFTNESGTWGSRLVLGSIVNGTFNNFSYSFESDGHIIWTVKCTDLAGNIDPENRSVFLDFTPPTISFVGPTPGPAVILGPGNITVNVSVTDAPSFGTVDTCIMQFNREPPVEMTKVGIGNSVLCNATKEITTSGFHIINVTVNDSANDNNVGSSTRGILADLDPPQLLSIGVNDSFVLRGEDVEFNATWIDNIALKEWTFESNVTGTLTNVSGTFEGKQIETASIARRVRALGGSEVRWRFYVTDFVGNMRASPPQSFLVELRPSLTCTTIFLVEGGSVENCESALENTVANDTEVTPTSITLAIVESGTFGAEEVTITLDGTQAAIVNVSLPPNVSVISGSFNVSGNETELGSGLNATNVTVDFLVDGSLELDTTPEQLNVSNSPLNVTLSTEELQNLTRFLGTCEPDPFTGNCTVNISVNASTPGNVTLTNFSFEFVKFAESGTAEAVDCTTFDENIISVAAQATLDIPEGTDVIIEVSNDCGATFTEVDPNTRHTFGTTGNQFLWRITFTGSGGSTATLSSLLFGLEIAAAPGIVISPLAGQAVLFVEIFKPVGLQNSTVNVPLEVRISSLFPLASCWYDLDDIPGIPLPGCPTNTTFHVLNGELDHVLTYNVENTFGTIANATTAFSVPELTSFGKPIPEDVEVVVIEYPVTIIDRFGNTVTRIYKVTIWR